MQNLSTRWLIGIGIAVILTTIVVIVVILTVLVQDRQQAEIELLRVGLTATALAFTVPDATPTDLPSPTVSISELPFTMAFEQSANILIADGLSRQSISVETLDASLVGREILFVVNGGGSVEPASAALPAIGEMLRVDYVAATSDGTIRIDGLVPYGNRTLTQSVTTTLEYEQASLTGQPMLPDANRTVIVTLSMVRDDGLPLRGTYEIRLRTQNNRGTFQTATGEVVESIQINTYTPTVTLQFIPLPSVESERIVAQVASRIDIPNLSFELFWSNLTTAIQWTSASNNPLVPLPIGVRAPLCFMATGTNQLMLPPRLVYLKYHAVLSSDNRDSYFMIEDNPLPTNISQRFSDADFTGSPFYQLEGQYCFIPNFEIGAFGGLYELTIQAEYPAVANTMLVLAHHGSLTELANPATIVLQDGQTMAGTLDVLPTALPTIYRVNAADFSQIIVSFLVQGQFIAADGRSLMLSASIDETALPSTLNIFLNATTPATLTAYQQHIGNVYAMIPDGGFVSDQWYPVWMFASLQ